MLNRINDWLDSPITINFKITKRELGFVIGFVAMMVTMYFLLKIAFNA